MKALYLEDEVSFERGLTAKEVTFLLNQIDSMNFKKSLDKYEQQLFDGIDLSILDL